MREEAPDAVTRVPNEDGRAPGFPAPAVGLPAPILEYGHAAGAKYAESLLPDGRTEELPRNQLRYDSCGNFARKDGT